MAEWYYVSNGQQAGPISLDELKQKIGSGELAGSTLVWTQGQSDWAAASSIPSLSAGAGQASPPPPSPSPTATPTAPGPGGAAQGNPLGPQQPANPLATTADSAYRAPRSPGGSVPAKPDNYLWQSIVATLLCCLPFGVVGIVFAAKVDGHYYAGEYALAYEAAKKAKTWTTVSVVCWLVVAAVYFLLFFVGVASGM